MSYQCRTFVAYPHRLERQITVEELRERTSDDLTHSTPAPLPWLPQGCCG